MGSLWVGKEIRRKERKEKEKEKKRKKGKQGSCECFEMGL